MRYCFAALNANWHTFPDKTRCLFFNHFSMRSFYPITKWLAFVIAASFCPRFARVIALIEQKHWPKKQKPVGHHRAAKCHLTCKLRSIRALLTMIPMNPNHEMARMFANANKHNSRRQRMTTLFLNASEHAFEWMVRFQRHLGTGDHNSLPSTPIEAMLRTRVEKLTCTFGENEAASLRM